MSRKISQIEKQLLGLTSNGIDCSAWANRHEYAFSNVQLHPYNQPNTLGSPGNKEPKMMVNGKQFIVVSNGFVENADTREQAQAVAEKLAHANQADAYILAPIARTAPKRDVVTTEISL